MLTCSFSKCAGPRWVVDPSPLAARLGRGRIGYCGVFG